MPEKTTLSLASPMEEEDMENCVSEKKITNLTKVRTLLSLSHWTIRGVFSVFIA